MEDAVNIPAVNIEAADDQRPLDASAQLLQLYADIADTLPGAGTAAIRALRDEAIAGFAAKGLPHRRVEEWKYTDLRRLMSDVYSPRADASGITATAIEAALGDLARLDAVKLVFVNGALRPKLSEIGGLPEGVELTSLAEALKSPPEWLLAVLGKVNPLDGDIVAQLNTAFMTDGAVLRLGAGVKLGRPVHLIHVSAGERPVASSLRNLVDLEAGSELKLIETYVCIGGSAVQTNVTTELKIAPSARLRHYKVSGETGRAQHLASTMVDMAEKADYLAVNFADSGAVARHQTFLRFRGDGGRAHFYGAQLLKERQHCDMTLVIDHAAVGCESREHVKAVLADQSQGVFQAKVIVRPDAQQTDGRQMAQALLLSDGAEFDAKPELEIYADDVKCNHGATCGALDDDLMFYLRARGIPEDEARALLVQAFIGEVLEQVEHDGLGEALAARAARWLA
jgi:Fe-S cluster assembly protein SufD